MSIIKRKIIDPVGATDIDGVPPQPAYMDRDGKRVDIRTWGLLFEDAKYRMVKRTEALGVLVSTVWIGVRPNTFETMVWQNDREIWSIHCSSEEDAIRHHALGVSLYLPMWVLKDGEWVPVE